MSDIEFIQLGKEILNEMQYTDAWSNKATGLFEKMEKLKIHILKNPNNVYVKYFIEELMNRYIKLFFNQGLIDAFYEPQPFYRQIQVYKNLPFTIYPSYGVYLFKILELSGFPYFYLGFKSALEQYRKELLDDQHIKNVFEFVEKNQNIIKSLKDEYGSLDEEKLLYYKAFNGESFQELKDFMWANSFMGQYEAREPFMRKKEGNIGELYAFGLINQGNKVFVVKDIKNGFGYDIYYSHDHVENLVEVKTTLKDISVEDSFDLSENEYRVMQQCIDNPLVNYIVCRIKLGEALNLVSSSFLFMVDSTTFVDPSTGTEYKKEEQESPIVFKKSPQKIKVYSQN